MKKTLLMQTDFLFPSRLPFSFNRSTESNHHPLEKFLKGVQGETFSKSFPLETPTPYPSTNASASREERKRTCLPSL
jgi:hypothetical protein